MRGLFSSISGRMLAWLMIGGAVVLVGLIGVLPQPDNPAAVSRTGLSTDWQSAQVEKIAAQLPSSQVQAALVVVSKSDGTPLSSADVATIEQRSAELGRFAVGGRVPPPRVSEARDVALVAVPMSTAGEREDLIKSVKDLRATTATWQQGLRVEVTGGPAFTADLSAVFDGANTTLLIVTASVVAVLLLVTYRSPILWLVPLFVVGGAEQITIKVVERLVPAVGINLNVGETTGIASVLVFGAATDYALLLIARYREELRANADRFAAMGRAVRRTAEPVLASGGTVILAVLTLMLSAVEKNRALGMSCAIGVLFAMIAALVILPAVLVLCGRKVFWPLVPEVGSPAREGKVWGRLGEQVLRRPIAVTLASVVALAAMASGMIGLRSGLSENEQFRVKPEAVRGSETLGRAFPAGTTQPAIVLSSEQAADRAVAAAKTVRGVATADVAERAAGIARISVVLVDEPGTKASDQALRDLRDALAGLGDSAPPAGGTLGSHVPEHAIVGGTVAEKLDLKDADGQDRWRIMPLILLLVGAVLLALLRSLVGPLLLVATVIASFFASLGLSWLVFDHVVNYPAVDPDVILLAFVFLVALGVDYNIFLVSRAREDAATSGTRAGMLSALRVTGGVITSAGVLLAAVFAVLGVLPLTALTQIGIIVCIGVLLDTLLVRTVLVPAMAFGLNDRFWWPGRPAKAGVAGAAAGAGAAVGVAAAAAAGAGAARDATENTGK